MKCADKGVSGRDGKRHHLPESVGQYLMHIRGGVSIRDLARRHACHASTLSRRMRRIEIRRDDPLFDAALRRLENSYETLASDLRRGCTKEPADMTKLVGAQPGLQIEPDLQKEATRILRRMCETGAVMAVAKDMDTAVVVREGGDGAGTRTALRKHRT